jgi:EmrB/QacA subfamily drug resistance transporter
MITAIREPCDESVIRAGVATAVCSASSGKWVLAATILASSMAFIDGTVVNVALPALQTDLNASVQDVQWVIEAYALFLAALLLVGGSLGDHYGRRRVFLIGVVLFAAASAWCGIAANIGQLILARATQGVGAALLVPGSLAIISSSFREEERGRAIGTWSGFSAMTAAIGPVLGGWLVDQVSWRAVFFINIPLAIVVIVISFWRVPEIRSGTKGPLDWPGAVLAAVSLGALVFALIESARLGFAHPAVVSSMLIGGGGLVAFLVVEWRSRHPMLPLELFRSRIFTGANLLTLFLYSALAGTLFFLPLNLIQVQRYTPTRAGAALLPLILIIFLLSRWSGGLVDRYGARMPLVLGPMIAAIGFALFTLPGVGGSYWTNFFPAVVVLGVGMAVSVAPLTTTVMNSVAQTRVGIASGVNNAVARTAGLLAIAVLGLVMLQSFDRALDARAAELSLPVNVRRSLEEQRNKLAAAKVISTEPVEREAVKEAIALSFVDAFRRVMFVGSGLAAVSAITALALIRPTGTARNATAK